MDAANFVIRFLLIGFALIQGLKGSCEDGFQCRVTGKCIPQIHVCDEDSTDCGDDDESDEQNCDPIPETEAPYIDFCSPNYRCTDRTCITKSSICDGTYSCTDGSDEIGCDVAKVADLSAEKLQSVQWFLNRRYNNTVLKWGLQLHRTAVALYLADEGFFSPGNHTGQEIRYELAVQLLSRMYRREILRTEQLALYVNAMVVACLNPHDFYSRDLVSELRKRVNMSSYANPFAILVLCNAGANITRDDVSRLNRTFYSSHRPYWTEIQAISTLALSCIASKTSVPINKNTLRQWVDLAKRFQLGNGTVMNPRTTALIIQMLLGTDHTNGFNWQAAVRAILMPEFIFSSNYLDRYYLIPVLSNRSPATINSSHCSLFTPNDELFPSEKERHHYVHYSVWIEREIDFSRSWRLKIPSPSSLYDVIKKVQILEPNHRVKYNIVDGKPYVRSVSGVDEDTETDHYWFTYKRAQRSSEEPTLIEDSPVDINTIDNEEFILWYRIGLWNSESYGSGELP